MATYVNDLRLKEIATGDESGTWGTSTNTNLELIAESMGSGTEVVADASTHTITMADGATDGFRCTFLRLTGGGQACTVTLAPNTLSHTWVIRNATSYALTFTQGSGANVIIAAGQAKIVVTDGAGSGAIVYECLEDLELGGTLTVGIDDAGYDVKFFGATSGNYLLWDESADSLLVNGDIDMVTNGNRIDLDTDNDTSIRASADDTITFEVGGSDLIALTTTSTFSCPVTVGVDDTGHDVKFFGATSGAYMLWDESADDLKLVGAAGLTVAGDVDIDGTLNVDAIDIDGALQLDGALTVGVDDTGYDVKFFGATSGSYLLWDESADALLLTDSTPLKLGDSQDLEIYHDGSNSYIKDTGTGSLVISSGGLFIQNAAANENMIRAVEDGAVTLYYDDSAKLDTVTGGINITGDTDTDTLTVSGNATVSGATTLSSNVTTNNGYFYFNEDGGDYDFRVESSGNANMLFVDGGSDDVGIGTATASSYFSTQLVVSAPNTGGITIAAEATDATNYLMFADGTTGNEAYRGYIVYGHTLDALSFATAGATKVTIDSSGLMGLGTTSPSSYSSGADNLVVYGAGSAGITIATGDTTSTVALKFADGTASATENAGFIDYAHASDYMSFGTANTEQFRISSDGSLSTPTLGTSNVRFGVNAGDGILSGGTYNTVVGDEAGTAITTGDNNTALGYEALNGIVTTANSTAVGYRALKEDVAGLNAAFGYTAGAAIDDGTRNTAIGPAAMDGATSGDDNTAVGANALGAGTNTASDNTAIGSYAMQTISTGHSNTAVGYTALDAEDTGSACTAIGFGALSQQNNDASNYNTAVGWNAGYGLTTALRSTAVGASALNAIVTGNDNTAVGYDALGANTSGTLNTAVGQGALVLNTEGGNNVAVGNSAAAAVATVSNVTAIGYSALGANTIDYSVAVGSRALALNQAGAKNTAVGTTALRYNTSGGFNTAVGYEALNLNNTASNNTAMGYLALKSATDASAQNTAIGSQAMQDSSGAEYNTVVGYYAGKQLSTGNYNVAVGANALDYICTGSYNNAVGYLALSANTSGASNQAFGAGAGKALTTGSQNVAIGHDALSATDVGGLNISIGYQSMLTNIDGSRSTAVGYQSLYAQEPSGATDMYNVAVGHIAGYGITTGIRNIAIGSGTLQSTATGNDNVAVGHNAASALTSGGQNTFVGNYAGGVGVVTGSNSTAVGYKAGEDLTSGGSNTLLGELAGSSMTTGIMNTALGNGTLATNVAGDNNIAVGFQALYTMNPSGNVDTNNIAMGLQAGYYMTTGVNNILIGTVAGSDLNTGSKNLLIGGGVQATAEDMDEANALGYAVVPAEGYTTLGISGAAIRAAHGVATWAAVSDERYKKNITDSTAGLSFINDLRPRTFEYKNLGDLPEAFNAYEADSAEAFINSDTNHGFIAQEVKTVIDAHSEIKDGFRLWDDRPDGSQELGEAALIPVLVKAIQELSAEIDKLKA